MTRPSPEATAWEQYFHDQRRVLDVVDELFDAVLSGEDIHRGDRSAQQMQWHVSWCSSMRRVREIAGSDEARRSGALGTHAANGLQVPDVDGPPLSDAESSHPQPHPAAGARFVPTPDSPDTEAMVAVGDPHRRSAATARAARSTRFAAAQPGDGGEGRAGLRVRTPPGDGEPVAGGPPSRSSALRAAERHGHVTCGHGEPDGSRGTSAGGHSPPHRAARRSPGSAGDRGGAQRAQRSRPAGRRLRHARR